MMDRGQTVEDEAQSVNVSEIYGSRTGFAKASKSKNSTFSKVKHKADVRKMND